MVIQGRGTHHFPFDVLVDGSFGLPIIIIITTIDLSDPLPPPIGPHSHQRLHDHHYIPSSNISSGSKVRYVRTNNSKQWPKRTDSTKANVTAIHPTHLIIGHNSSPSTYPAQQHHYQYLYVRFRTTYCSGKGRWGKKRARGACPHNFFSPLLMILIKMKRTPASSPPLPN